MKLAFKIILIAFLGFWAEQVFPWWTVAVCAALISALIPTKSSRAFLCGFASIALLWLLCGLVFSIQSDFLLTERVARLFSVNSSIIILLVTSLIGGIVGGMGALCGNQLRQTLQYKAPYRSRHQNLSKKF